MTTPLPIGSGAPDVRADEELSWLLPLDSTVFAVLGGVLLVFLLVTALIAWLVVRRIRRSPLVARGRDLAARSRELGVQGVTAVAARRLPPGRRRTAAELRLQICRGRDRLRAQVAGARAAGAHLGDIPGLLPSLEAQGSRLEQRLQQQALASEPHDRTDPDLDSEARAHLDLLDDVCDAVRQAERVVSATSRAAGDVADAVTALRAHTAAYEELTAPPAATPEPWAAPPSPGRAVRNTPRG